MRTVLDRTRVAARRTDRLGEISTAQRALRMSRMFPRTCLSRRPRKNRNVSTDRGRSGRFRPTFIVLNRETNVKTFLIEGGASLYEIVAI